MYPERLLPSQDYHKYECNNVNGDLYLSRKTDTKCIVDEEGDFDETILRIKEFFAYSTLLVQAGITSPEDVFYKVINKGIEKKWNPGEYIPNINEINYFYDNKKGCFKFNIQCILDENEFIFPKPNPKGKNKSHQFKLIICHEPTTCNYYHYELKVWDITENKEVSQPNLSKPLNSGTYREKIAHYIKSIISYIAEPVVYEVSEY